MNQWSRSGRTICIIQCRAIVVLMGASMPWRGPDRRSFGQSCIAEHFCLALLWLAQACCCPIAAAQSMNAHTGHKPIADYGLIDDSQTAVPVKLHGTLKKLFPPRF